MQISEWDTYVYLRKILRCCVGIKKLIVLFDARIVFIVFCKCGNTVYSLHWGDHKHRRKARSSATTDILAAAGTTNVLLYLQKSLNEFYNTHYSSIITNFKIASKLSTSVYEHSECLQKVAHHTTKEAFCFSLFSSARWCLRAHHAADALNKNERTAASHLDCVFQDSGYVWQQSVIVRISEDLPISSA